MATLEEQRRGIGQSITQSRQSSGGLVQPSRGSMESMAARRTGEQVVGDIQRLSSSNKPQSKKLEKLDPVGGISVPAGVGKPTGVGGGGSNGGGGGLDSYTEVANSRQYYTPTSITDRHYLFSNDGLVVLDISPIKSIVMQDSEGGRHTFNYINVALQQTGG